MWPSVRYMLGLALQCVGLLTAVFLVGVPIWWRGRQLCWTARSERHPGRPADD